MIRRASCPVACSVDRLADRGTLLVTRDLFAGKARFVKLEPAKDDRY